MRIVLKAHKSKGTVGNVVKIRKEAQKVLSTVMRETGLSAKYIVSQIIIQGFDLVEIREDKEQ